MKIELGNETPNEGRFYRNTVFASETVLAREKLWILIWSGKKSNAWSR